jgi:hypothetical protein
VTGGELWKKRKPHEIMPVLFGDAARDCSRLLYWAVLTDVRLEGDGTHFAIKELRKIKGRHTTQELVLRKTGKTIAPRFIRPYAICVTPKFLKAKKSMLFSPSMPEAKQTSPVV